MSHDRHRGTGTEPRTLVTCERVSRAYRSGTEVVTALDKVSCTVGAGARLALVGPSGSGKSTLLHLMAGLDAPTSGRVGWPALSIDPAARRSEIGVVFQGPSLVGELDVAENVGLPTLLHPTARPGLDVAEVADALARVGLAGLEQTLPDQLSGGQAQRVAVARVLFMRPRLILADEPTGRLDGQSGAQVVTTLLEAADRLDAALVVATHDRRVADRLARRWTMSDGRLHTPSGTQPSPVEDTGMAS